MPESSATPDTLDRWLAVATDCLTPESKDRVRAEITAHYQDALAAACEAGRSATDAQRLAIAALGPSWVARKKFRATYLWQGDLDRLRVLEKHPERTRREHFRIIMNLLAGILIAGTIIHFVFHEPWSQLIFLFFIFVTNLAFGTSIDGTRTRFILRDHAPGAERRFRKSIKVLLGLEIFSFYLYIMIATVSAFWQFDSPNSILQFSLIVTFLMLIALSLWSMLIKRECAIYISLKQKLVEMTREANQEGPDQYA